MFTSKMSAEKAREAIADLRQELQAVELLNHPKREAIQIHLCALIQDCEERIRRLEGAKYDFLVLAFRSGRTLEAYEKPFRVLGSFFTEDEAREAIAKLSKGDGFGDGFAIQKRERV